MGSYETITLEQRGDVALLTLNRPKAANTLSKQLMADFVMAIDELRNDDAVKVLVITGAGDRHFCGGADLRDMGDVAAAGKQGLMHRDPFVTLAQFHKPVIAAINGAAMGGGCEMSLAADFRLMAHDAQIGLTEILFGGLPAGGGTQRLPRLVGVAKAKELIMLGTKISADDAAACGLVNEVVPHDKLIDRAMELANELASLASFAVVAAKLLIDSGAEMSLDAALRMERTVIMSMGSPAEKKAAIEAAMAKSATYQNIFGGSKK